MSFYVGQKVVCVRTHSQGVVRSGETYTVTSVTETCNCGPVLTVGILAPWKGNKCPRCNSFTSGHTEWKFCAFLFRPLDELEQQLERIESEPVEEPEYA